VEQLNKENLKENLKIALLLTLILVAVATPIIAVANYIWSMEVDVTVTEPSEPVLTINDPPDGTTLDTYTFNGTLTLDGVPISGEVVTLYMNNATTGLTDITAVDGSYSIAWTPSGAGTFTFKTQVEI